MPKMSEREPARAVLTALFDSAQGWAFSEEEVPLKRESAPDGSPFVVVTVDDREIVVIEKMPWAGDEEHGPSPHRIVAFLAFSGIAVENANVLLEENLGTHGLPAWGVDDDGDLTLSISVLVGPQIPVAVTRAQVLVGLGLIAETVGNVVEAVSKENNEPAPIQAAAITRRFLTALQ